MSPTINIKINSIIHGIKKLPPTPQLLPELSKLLRDENSSMSDILSLIKVDQALTAQVVRASNSSFYGASDPCMNIEDSISRIGFNEVYKLVAFIAASNVFKGKSDVYKFEGSEIFYRSISCATIMQSIAKMKRQEVETPYTIGLMHLIGKVAISRYFTENKTEMVLGPLQKFGNTLELQYLGFDFAEVGSQLLKMWHFGEEITNPIQYQIEPNSSTEHLIHASMLNLAVESIEHIDKSAESIAEEFNPSEEILGNISISKDELIDCLITAQENLDDSKNLLRAA